MNIDFDGLRNSPWALPVGVGVAALAGGIGTGYAIGAYRWKQVADKARTDLYETSIEGSCPRDRRTRVCRCHK